MMASISHVSWFSASSIALDEVHCVYSLKKRAFKDKHYYKGELATKFCGTCFIFPIALQNSG